MNVTRRIANLPMTAAERRATQTTTVDTASLVLAGWATPTQINRVRSGIQRTVEIVTDPVVEYFAIWTVTLAGFTAALMYLR